MLHRHPHWKRLIGPALILILGSAAAAFVGAVVNRMNWEATAKNVIFIVIAVI